LVPALGCIRPPAVGSTDVERPRGSATPPPLEKMTEVDAWAAVPLMSPGVNIGNTLDNTTIWETGWGNPLITKDFVRSLAKLGYKSVRLPVAWDTYADEGKILPDKMARVAEVVDWITGAGMFCVVNIHWDGGWIDSDKKDKFPTTFNTFSADAEKKFKSYWEQISTFFAGKNEKLVFEALNEETNFSGAGSTDKAYGTLTHVNQLFIDTVRKTGGNNDKRLLIIAGYSTDIEKTCVNATKLPTDTIAHRLFISVHYYTPYTFCGLEQDADWGKMQPTWGSDADTKQLEHLFDMMQTFCTKHDIPAYIGEFGVTRKKESPSRVRWMSAVMRATKARNMIPVLWDTGGDISRNDPYTASDELQQTLVNAAAAPAPPVQAAAPAPAASLPVPAAPVSAPPPPAKK
jgi:endoglucanase